MEHLFKKNVVYLVFGILMVLVGALGYSEVILLGTGANAGAGWTALAWAVLALSGIAVVVGVLLRLIRLRRRSGRVAH